MQTPYTTRTGVRIGLLHNPNRPARMSRDEEFVQRALIRHQLVEIRTMKPLTDAQHDKITQAVRERHDEETQMLRLAPLRVRPVPVGGGWLRKVAEFFRSMRGWA
jgi:hypothetical protein